MQPYLLLYCKYNIARLLTTCPTLLRSPPPHSSSLDGCWPEVCNRLPLFDDNCYLTANPTSSFLETLIAGSGLPFAKQIITAKQKYDGFVNEIDNFSEEAHDFLLPDAEPFGQCFAFSDQPDKQMIGFSETPGFPPPLVYELCNCISMITTGIPACTIQVSVVWPLLAIMFHACHVHKASFIFTRSRAVIERGH